MSSKIPTSLHSHFSSANIEGDELMSIELYYKVYYKKASLTMAID